MNYRRDDEALKAAIETHSVQGMGVMAPIFGRSTIIEQGGTQPVRHVSPEGTKLGMPLLYYKVRADEAVPFSRWLSGKKGLPRELSKPLSLEEWTQFYGERYIPIPDYLMKLLENGHKISAADIEHDDLAARGCIDGDGKVSCYTFWQNQVWLDPRQLKPGQLVEYTGPVKKEERQYQGAIVAIKDDIAYLELFTPLAYLDLPYTIVSGEIQPSFYSPYTYQIGYGTYEALEIASEESGRDLIPPGKWDAQDERHRRLYTLKDFMPISVIQEICAAAYAGEPHCVWQSLILYVVPIALYPRSYSGTWRPLPEKSIPLDAIISYEDEDEG